MSLKLKAPAPLTEAHDIESFKCGETSLDDWLKHRAMGNQRTGASRTFVVADENDQVHGFYSMAAGAVVHQIATGSVRRNMPDPVPVMVLGRLAVNRQAQGMKLGAAMLRDAVARAVAISQDAGVRALLIHALDERAKRFYEYYGFKESPQQPLTLMLRLSGEWR